MICEIHNEQSGYKLRFERHRQDIQGNIFTLLQGFKCRWNDRRLYVPKGFMSDGASVPRIFWGLVFPADDLRALRAAFAHDYIYRHHPAGWTRAEADRLFYDIMVRDGVPVFKAWIAYQAVRLCGWYAWQSMGGVAA